MARIIQAKPAPLLWLSISILLILIIAVGVAGYFYVTQTRAPLNDIADRITADVPDYATEANWAVYPADPPPGGWEEPWGVDVLVFLSTPPANIADWYERIDEQSLRTGDLQSFEEAFEDENRMAIYAPVMRIPTRYAYSNADGSTNTGRKIRDADVSAAVSHYLTEANRQRGLVILTDRHLVLTVVQAMATEIEQRSGLQDRFGGIIRVASGGGDFSVSDDVLTCSTLVESPCIETHRASLAQIFDMESEQRSALVDILSTRSLAFSDAMMASLDKPVPPLPPLEAIEIAPINRPGVTEF